MSTGLKIVNWLKRLFISNRGVGDDALIYYVKGHKCGAITRVRINPSSELSCDDDDTFFVRKVVVDSQCYGRVEIVLRFDAAYRRSAATSAEANSPPTKNGRLSGIGASGNLKASALP